VVTTVTSDVNELTRESLLIFEEVYLQVKIIRRKINCSHELNNNASFSFGGSIGCVGYFFFHTKETCRMGLNLSVRAGTKF
jgi:hypothetical protein